MKLCFVIMPIGSGEAYDIHLNRYNNIIRVAVEEFRLNGEQAFKVLRADLISITGSINKKVIQHIYRADAVIADLTDLNPNVFYELGVRHSLRNGTILLALEGTKIPFDVQDLNVIFYKDRVGGEKEAIPKIQKLLGALLENEQVDDSPVFSILPELQDLTARDLIEQRARAAKLEAEVSELEGKLKVSEAINFSLHNSFRFYEQTITTFLAKLDPQEQAEAAREVEEAAKNKSKTKIMTVNLSSEIEDPSIVFVLMSLRGEMEYIYDVIRRTANNLGLTTMRADKIAAPGIIVGQTFDLIQHAGIIIADITDNSPNVMFEIGIAMSLKKKVIIIAEMGERVPFDVANFEIIFYEKTAMGMNSLGEYLERELKTIKA